MTTATAETAPDVADAPAKPRGFLHTIGLGLSFGLLAFVALVAGLVIVLPIATGSTAYTIMTGSMEPHYPPGTLVIVKPTDVEQIQIGDVVTYQIESGKPAVVTHRVIQVVHSSSGETRLITQGDANDVRDAGEVRPVQVRGTVWYAVPWIGWINNVLSGGTRAIIVPILAGGLFLYAGYMVAAHVIGRRRAARRDAAARLAAAEAERTAGVIAEAPATTESAPPAVTATVVTDDSLDGDRELEPAVPQLSRFAPRP